MNFLSDKLLLNKMMSVKSNSSSHPNNIQETSEKRLISLNPQTYVVDCTQSNGHCNPITQHKKRFLAQVKERAINGADHYKSNKPVKVEDKEIQQALLDKEIARPITNLPVSWTQTQTNSLPQGIKSFKMTDSIPKFTSVEKIGSSYPNRVDDNFRMMKEEIKFLKEKCQKSDFDLKKQIEKSFLKDEENRQVKRVADQYLASVEKKCRELQQVVNRLEKENKELNLQRQQDISNRQAYEDLYNKHQQVCQNFNKLNDYCNHLQQTLSKKDQYLQVSIQNKINQSNSLINFKNNQIKNLQNRIEILERENAALITQMKAIMPRLTEEKKNDEFTEEFIVIVRELEQHIEELSEENKNLKNIRGQNQGKIEELKTQNRSLDSIIQALEQRNELQKKSRFAFQIERLKADLNWQKQEQDRQASLLQAQILRLQNELDQRRYEVTGSLLDFTDSQKLFLNFANLIKEVQTLKEQINSRR